MQHSLFAIRSKWTVELKKKGGGEFIKVNVSFLGLSTV